MMIADAEKRDPLSLCLMTKTLLHPESGSCHVPLDQGPCPPGQSLVPASQPGTGTCSPLSPPHHCTNILLSDGSVGCEEELTRDLFSRGECGEGEVMLPENFLVDTMPCPHLFECCASRNNPRYNSALKSFQEKGHIFIEEKNYLKDLVCDYKSQSLCLPVENRDSLFTVENLLASLVTPSARCQANPCPQGRTPWLSEDGHYRCYI